MDPMGYKWVIFRFQPFIFRGVDPHKFNSCLVAPPSQPRATAAPLSTLFTILVKPTMHAGNSPEQISARWFKVTFVSPSWRSLNPLKGSLNHPKKGTLNHQVGKLPDIHSLKLPTPMKNGGWENTSSAYFPVRTVLSGRGDFEWFLRIKSYKPEIKRFLEGNFLIHHQRTRRTRRTRGPGDQKA